VILITGEVPVRLVVPLNVLRVSPEIRVFVVPEISISGTSFVPSSL